MAYLLLIVCPDMLICSNHSCHASYFDFKTFVASSQLLCFIIHAFLFRVHNVTLVLYFLLNMSNINGLTYRFKILLFVHEFNCLYYVQERKPELTNEIMTFRDYLLSSTVSDTLDVWELKGIAVTFSFCDN